MKLRVFLITSLFLLSGCASSNMAAEIDASKIRLICENFAKVYELAGSNDFSRQIPMTAEQQFLLDAIKRDLIELSSATSSNRPKQRLKALSNEVQILLSNEVKQLQMMYFCGAKYFPGSRNDVMQMFFGDDFSSNFTIEEYLGLVPDPEALRYEREKPRVVENEFDLESKLLPLVIFGAALLYFYLVHRFAKWVAGTASRAGRSFQGWYVVSLIVPVLAVLVVLTFPKSTTKVAAVEELKKCPMCAEEIKFAAKKCRHCQHMLEN